MRVFASFTAAALLATGLATTPAQAAEPGGCLRYGAVGAVGGHLAHHGVLGALGGCAAGAYRRHEYRKQQRAAARQNQNAGYNGQQNQSQGGRPFDNGNGYNGQQQNRGGQSFGNSNSHGYNGQQAPNRGQSFDNGGQSQPFTR